MRAYLVDHGGAIWKAIDVNGPPYRITCLLPTEAGWTRIVDDPYLLDPLPTMDFEHHHADLWRSVDPDWRIPQEVEGLRTTHWATGRFAAAAGPDSHRVPAIGDDEIAAWDAFLADVKANTRPRMVRR